jgi:uncharacterized protein (TIGR00251 family)
MVLPIRVKPNSRHDRISKENGVLTIRVHAPAQEGKANKAVVEFLSETMDIPKSYIEIIGGLTSANKRVSIHDNYKARVEAVINSL